MLTQRGFRQCTLSSFFYLPPVKNEYFIKKLEFFNEMGKMIWPFPAGFYCFVAQKYSSSLLINPCERKQYVIPEETSWQPSNKWIHPPSPPDLN